jgi:multidrug efflux pump subunit AcrB
MTLLMALAVSWLLYRQLPVSLLPAVDIPQITIAVTYRNAGPEEIEQRILKPLRETMLTLNGLKAAESVAQNEGGKLTLSFHFGTAMNLAYIEANEKLDRLTPALPRDLTRPIVARANTSDIPVVRIQAIPKNPADALLLSELATQVLRRRIEQQPGVGLVDMNGVKRKIISVRLHTDRLRSLQLAPHDVAQAIRQVNQPLGSITVKEGAYQYQLNIENPLTDAEAVKNIRIDLLATGQSVALRQVADVRIEPEAETGFHLFQGTDAVVITVHKQDDAKMPELMPKIYGAVDQFRAEYPQFAFATTQDQSQLLTVSIDNLSQAVVWGGAIAFAVLFLFMRGWREPLLMGIVLPLSLLLAFSLFRAFGLSLNIISLSGLALGLGMLVDNSIVVMESILMKRKQGLTVFESCVCGTEEVMAPLLSSALTNLAVFVPLIFLSGLTGALFYDQALSVIAILSVSLLCTFVIVPLLYLILFRNRTEIPPEDSRFFLWLKERYACGFDWIWARPKTSFAIMLALVPVGIAATWFLPRQAFPAIEKTESFVRIDWNEAVSVSDNRDRVTALLEHLKPSLLTSEADIGQQQYVLNEDIFGTRDVEIYWKASSSSTKQAAEVAQRTFLRQHFPAARYEVRDAPNAFEQLFESRQPELEARLRTRSANSVLAIPEGDSLLAQLANDVALKPEKGFEKQTMLFVKVDFEKMDRLGIAFEDLLLQLRLSFGSPVLTTLNTIGAELPVVAAGTQADFLAVWQTREVPSKNGFWYPLRELASVRFEESHRYLTADAGGIYQSIELANANNRTDVMQTVNRHIRANDLSASWSGQVFENEQTWRDLVLILLVSVVLVYVILTAEFESLKQPFIVMLTLPIGLAGGVLLLWATGGTLNVMAGIGLIVVLGVLDNDAILKIDRINRLRQTLPLEAAIRQAGKDRLKPIVMNTCTNVLALTPILFSSGLGAELQRPVAITSIGGLVVGTFTALYFIPLTIRLLEINKR